MKIREARKAKGLTMKELGARVGTTESAISLYETGKREPPYQMLLMIAEELDTTVCYLLGIEQPNYTPKLSSDEQFILDSFRNFSQDGKKAVLQYIETMNASGLYTQSNSVKLETIG